MNKVGTYTFIQRIIDLLDTRVYIDLVGTTTDGYTFYSHNTKWITFNYTITINGTDYVVSSITPNVSFSIVTTDSISLQLAQIIIVKPFFFHGTILNQKTELNTILDYKDKTPFIYLNEPSNDRFYYDVLDARDRDSDCELYLMAESDWQDWTNEQHHVNAVRAMNNLMDEFILAMRNCSFIGEFDNYSTEVHVKWGQLSNKGHITNIFDERLSGIKTQLTIPILKEDCCDNCEPYVSPITGEIIVKNSDDSYLVTTSQNLTLPDEEINVYLDGQLVATETYIPLSNTPINIQWT